MTAKGSVALGAVTTALTPAVRAELERRKQGASPRLAQRALVVLLAAEGISDRRIAMLTRMHHNRVAVWRHRFAAQGLPGLEDEPRPGRPPRRDVAALLAVAGVPGGDVAPSSAWRARRVLELNADRSDLVSRLVAEHRDGQRLTVAGVLLQPRCSAVAIVSGEAGASVRFDAGGDKESVDQPAGGTSFVPLVPGGVTTGRGVASVFGFVAAVAREWRGSGRVHVLLEHGGAVRQRRPRREPERPHPVELWPTRSRAAWTAQAEVVVELARVGAPLAGLAGVAGLVAVEELRDHRRRTGGEWRILRRGDGAERSLPDATERP